MSDGYEFTMTDAEVNLGTIYVQRDGDVPPERTLFATVHPRHGFVIVDRDGRAYSPRSATLGYVARAGRHDATLVCDDDASAETIEALRAKGYPVARRS